MQVVRKQVEAMAESVGIRLPPGLESARNVHLALSFAVLSALATMIAHGHVFTAYIFEIYGDNRSVGVAESISGITSLASAVPVGIAVDKFPRTKLLWFVSVVGMLAALSGGLAVALGPIACAGTAPDERHSPGHLFTALMIASLTLWGFFFSAASAGGAALFADSIPAGPSRRKLYAAKTTATMLAAGGGPLLTLFLTQVLGNDWKLEHMASVLLVGFALVLPASIVLLFYEEVGYHASPRLAQPLLTDAEAPERGDMPAQPLPTPHVGRASPSSWRWTVPYLLVVSELITAIGAGMTVKFFSLWFKNDFDFSPAGLAALQTVTPLCIIIAVQALQAAAGACPWGPAPAVLAFWLTSVVCLLAMTRTRHVPTLILLHLVRVSLANCKEPVTRAILADHIPSEQRGRWNAVQSLSSITWSGSAALGGILCDRYGYGRTFVATAGLYVFAALFWVPLIYLVPADPKHKKS